MAPKSTTKPSDDDKKVEAAAKNTDTSTAKASDDKAAEATNTDVNATTETVAGPAVEDARDGTTAEQNRLDQNVPAGLANDFDPKAMGLDPVPYGKAK